MPLYVLGTDITSLLRKGHPIAAARMQSAPAGDVAVTVITVEEQLTGWYTALRQAKQPQQVVRTYHEIADAVRFYAQTQILDFTLAAITRYQSLLAMKLNVGKYDLKIAAIALEVGAVVVTRNIRDFARIPSLVVEDWSQPPGP